MPSAPDKNRSPASALRSSYAGFSRRSPVLARLSPLRRTPPSRPQAVGRATGESRFRLTKSSSACAHMSLPLAVQSGFLIKVGPCGRKRPSVPVPVGHSTCFFLAMCRLLFRGCIAQTLGGSMTSLTCTSLPLGLNTGCRGRCVMVRPLPSKQKTRVRFPPPAPFPPMRQCQTLVRVCR